MPEHTPAPTPSRAVYGFVMYLGFKLFFVLFLIWAYIPHSWFEAIGITYLPDRYWALSVPAFLLTILTVFAFFIYPSLGLCMTPDWNDLETIRDAKSKRNSCDANDNLSNKIVCSCINPNTCKINEFRNIRGTLRANRISPLQDLNSIYVSQRLYLNKDM